MTHVDLLDLHTRLTSAWHSYQNLKPLQDEKIHTGYQLALNVIVEELNKQILKRRKL